MVIAYLLIFSPGEAAPKRRHYFIFFHFLSLQYLVWCFTHGNCSTNVCWNITDSRYISCSPYRLLEKHLVVYWLMKISWGPIIAETKFFPMIIYYFYMTEEKRMDYFSLSSSCSTDLIRLHIDAKLHARYTCCLL